MSLPMSRWLSKDVIHMPLGTIEAEISALTKTSRSDRTVLDEERFADLREARKRITGARHA
jgi:hypothetical protein